jgi:hypothetical protein
MTHPIANLSLERSLRAVAASYDAETERGCVQIVADGCHPSDAAIYRIGRAEQRPELVQFLREKAAELAGLSCFQ